MDICCQVLRGFAQILTKQEITEGETEVNEEG